MSESKEPSPRIDWTPWVHADLFFLQNALAHGMSIAEIAEDDLVALTRNTPPTPRPVRAAAIAVSS
jgi:hypothetical protein